MPVVKSEDNFVLPPFLTAKVAKGAYNQAQNDSPASAYVLGINYTPNGSITNEDPATDAIAPCRVTIIFKRSKYDREHNLRKYTHTTTGLSFIVDIKQRRSFFQFFYICCGIF